MTTIRGSVIVGDWSCSLPRFVWIGMAILMILCPSHGAAAASTVLNNEDSTRAFVISFANQGIPWNMKYDSVAFMHWSAKVRERVFPLAEAALSAQPAPCGLRLTIRQYHDRKVEYAVDTKPPLPDSIRQRILQACDSLPDTRLRIGIDCMDFILLKPQIPVDTSWYPFGDEATQLNANLPGFEQATSRQQYQMLRDWATQEVIPVLGSMCTGVEEKYEGVRSFGKQVLELGNRTDIDLKQMVDGNEAYWRATMEMAQGDQLIAALHIHLLIATGYFDQARRLLPITRTCSRVSYVTWYLDFLRNALDVFYAQFESRISLGIDHYDRGYKDSAMILYDSMMAHYPNSARLRHERLLTSMPELVSSTDVRPLKEDQTRIYDCDAFHPSGLCITTGQAAYQHFRRIELSEELKDTSMGLEDKLAKLADIGLDLDEYSIAGLVYWLLLTHAHSNESRAHDYLCRYVFCMQRLQQLFIIKQFKKEIQDCAEQVGIELVERMRESSAYNIMARPK